MKKVAETAKRFGVVDNLQPVLAMALGAGETTVLRLTTAYSMIVNGGKKVTPTLIDRVQDKLGRTIFRTRQPPLRRLRRRRLEGPGAAADPRYPRAGGRSRQRLSDGLHAAGRRAARHRRRSSASSASRSPARPARPTTPTTSGSSASRPISPSASTSATTSRAPSATRPRAGPSSRRCSTNFIAEALKDQPNVPFRVPPGIRLVRVDLDDRPARRSPATAGSSSRPSSPAPSPMATAARSSWASASPAPARATRRRPAADSSGGLY